MKAINDFLRLLFSALIGIKSQKKHQQTKYSQKLWPYLLAGIISMILVAATAILLAQTIMNTA